MKDKILALKVSKPALASRRTTGLKPRGSALLISIVLAGLMLTVGVLSARLALREVQLSANLLLAEKAYLSAESGVEKALWQLKNDPIAHVAPSPSTKHPSLEDEFTEVSIRNLIDNDPATFPSPPALIDNQSFAFVLESLQSQKFRFRQDTDPGPSTAVAAVSGPVQVTLTNPAGTSDAGTFFWRFLCEEAGASTTTLALQGQINGVTTVADLTQQDGNTDEGTKTTFNDWDSLPTPEPLPDKNQCYLSLQNLSPDARQFAFTGTTMAPHAAHIHAMGKHRSRQKHIRFDYPQNSLGALFDFSFLHSDGGLISTPAP